MKRTENYFMDRPQPGKAERKERDLNARHSGSMKTGYKEELPGMPFDHRARKRKKPSSTARDSSEDRLERDDCSPKRVRRQRRGSVSSEASDCSVDSALESDCSVDSALGSDCSVDSALGSDCSVDSALGSDCSAGSPAESVNSLEGALETDCSVDSKLASDCSVDRPMESDTSVSRTENSNPEPSVSSHDQHHGNRTMDDESFKKIFKKLLERRTYMWRKALLNKRDYSKGRSVGSRKSPEARVTSATSRCSVGSPETTRCSVDSPEASDCPVDSPSIDSVRRVSPQKPQRSQTLGSPLAPVNSATSDCSVDWILSFTSGRSRVNGSENITTEVEMEVLEKTSLKTFLMASHRRAAAAGSEEVHAFSQLATYVRNFIKEYPEDLERISKDDLNNLNEKDSFTASLLPPSSPARVISMDSPMASVSSVASDCSEDRFINFSSGNPQSSQPCRHCGSSRMNEGLQRDHSSFKKPFPGKNAFIRRSSQSSLPKASPAASEAYVDSPLASVSSVASDCSEDRFINFSSGNPQSSQPCSAPARVISMDSPLASVSSVASDCSEDRFLNFSSGNPQSSQPCRHCGSSRMNEGLQRDHSSFKKPFPGKNAFIGRSSQSSLPKASPAASEAYVDSPLASVSSVASDCSEDRFLNFSSGNPQSSQPCSSPARVISMDSPMASVSSVASDCSEDRFINFSSGNPQSSQPCRHCGSSRMNEGLQRDHSSFKKPFPGKNAFIRRSSQSSLPKASPAASEAYVDSPLASVSSVASDCSEDRFINFSSGNPQSSQPCSAPASVISMDSPLASVSSVASDCSEDRFLNFSSGNPQSSQPCRAAAGSDAPPVSLHDTGSSWLDTIEMTFTDYHFLEVNDLQSSPNTTSWSAPTPVYCQDSYYEDIEDRFSIIEDYLINLNEKASRTASASPSLPRMAAKEMIIAETASDTLVNSSGKPNTQRKPALSKTTQRKTPQPNHNSKPDSSVNKENSARPDFYNQGTVSSSAHGDFINNRANFRKPFHFCDCTGSRNSITCNV
ncbi:uncharacterized protein LOC117410065 isoform X2 [Acipenser ruthenus]|uniref:uncharacterized protein LOC117410065 isoform X2 n=1 Tax=Acipenser ruthenus TaxID=7906 RepID=UPI0027418F1F|nr:uncharacterized protein LOC117410065 isoform X2 [Acipenser ruthenus]